MKALPSLKPDDILEMSWQNLNQYFVELGAINDEMKESIDKKKNKKDVEFTKKESMSLKDLREFPGATEMQ